MSSFNEKLLSELYEAYFQARKGKRKTLEEHNFELNEAENLVRLRDAIANRTYKTGRNRAFIIRDPVVREVFAAPFRDRVVHHYLYNQSYAWWDRRLIFDSYSCREGKGTLFGQKRLRHHILGAMENSGSAFAAKLDIQGYFMSLKHKNLYERVLFGLDRQFPEKGELYRTLKYLWKIVIFDKPTEKVKILGRREDWRELPREKSLFFQPEGQGIVIGNLTSQLLSNIYLDQLDRFVKFRLGYEHYGRYVDDFYIVVPSSGKAQLLRDILVIADYLESLGLKLHPKKQYKQEVSKGVPFIGAVVYPWGIVPAKRIKGRTRRALKEFSEGRRDLESVKSYLGMMKNYRSKKFLRDEFERWGLSFDFEELKERN